MARINYLELPVADTAAAKRFYADAFGWSFSDEAGQESLESLTRESGALEIRRLPLSGR